MVTNILCWFQGRAQHTIAATIAISPLVLFFGWGLIIQLDVDLPPGRGLELVELLSYSLLATASHSPMKWLEKQSPRKLLGYRMFGLALRTLFIMASVISLGLVLIYFPANTVPFGEVFGLDEQSLSLAYFIQVGIGVLIVSYIAELLSLISFVGALPFLTIATYIGLIYMRPIFHFVFPQSLDFVSIWQVSVCGMLACAVAITGHLRSQSHLS